MKKIKDLEIIDLDSEQETASPKPTEAEEHTKQKAKQPKPADEEEERPDIMDILTGKLGHIIFILIILIFLFVIVYKVWNWGTTIKSEYDPNNINTDYELEVLDNFVPHSNETDIVGVDDGKTTIVAFGNAPFADDRDSEDSLANMIEEKTGATVINCAVSDTYLAAAGPHIQDTPDKMDFFNLYWLSTVACVDNDMHLETIEGLPQEALDVVEKMQDIDWETVDVVTIMYDGQDYLDGRPVLDENNLTNIQTTYGNLCASLELFQQFYPYIRIIVMSPTYAFGIDDNGEYISSDIKIYNEHPLSTYAGMMERGAYVHYVSYLDHIYGTVHEDNATQYLTDNIHLNLAGREAVAERFKYALEYFD